MMDFKDLFSTQAADYARYRPRYPDALFDYLASVAPSRGLAWDVGTGNGQAAVELARRFGRVVATDPSEKQISAAAARPNIEYRVASAEASGFEDGCADLITAAQAFHWFRQEVFYREARRVGKPGAIVAIWTYAIARITPEVDAAVMRLYDGTLKGYWEKERKLVEEGYRSVAWPFEEITPPRIEMRADWSLADLVGYLGTWSALQTYIRKNGVNPLEALYPDLGRAWGEAATRPVSWELGLRVARVS
jgi:SAM-dependent methyltransferase